jgi:hypothetical protein
VRLPDCIREDVLGSSFSTRDIENSGLGSTCAVDVDKQNAVSLLVNWYKQLSEWCCKVTVAARHSTTGLPFAKVFSDGLS